MDGANKTVYNAAVAYRKKGVSVFPVGKDKKPVIKEWNPYRKRFATDEELQEWFIKNNFGIAIVTGILSKLTVVDIDPRHGGTTVGLPPTLTAKTQSGGWHFYYQYYPLVKNRSNIRPGVDIRTEGGYVVAPPTIGEHGVYKWIINERPQLFPAAILPQDAKKHPIASYAYGVSEGMRNDSAASVIGHVLSGIHPNYWIDFGLAGLREWNKRNTPPLSDHELQQTFRSIAAREYAKYKGYDQRN